jgi:hypothetical protein
LRALRGLNHFSVFTQDFRLGYFVPPLSGLGLVGFFGCLIAGVEEFCESNVGMP